MGDKPSWLNSTLAQMAVASVGSYLLGALWISFKTQDITSLKWAAELFGASYLATRSMQSKNSNGEVHEPAQSPAPVTPS